MRYFVLRGLLPQTAKGAPFFGGDHRRDRDERLRSYATLGHPLPIEGERPIVRVKGIGRISVFVFNLTQSLLLLAASSQERAYALANPFRGYLTVYHGVSAPEGLWEYVIELNRKPLPEWTIGQIAQAYRQLGQSLPDTDLLEFELASGAGVFWEQIEAAARFAQATCAAPRLSTSLLHLERSHMLFSGYMTSSYYHFHYRIERREESPYLRRKRYLEERTRFDLAFLSAFRSIESVLGTPHLKKHTIARALQALDSHSGTSLASGRWRSYHEFFSTRRRSWSYEAILQYYLDIRNAVAAHGNLAPPFRLAEDQVLEIQRLAEDILYQVAFPQCEREDA